MKRKVLFIRSLSEQGLVEACKRIEGNRALEKLIQNSMFRRVE
jgi:hypothetical protein